jgi:hypothetical protein
MLLVAALVVHVLASFPSEPIAMEAVNMTDSIEIGTVTECRTVASEAKVGQSCAAKGKITERGIVPINMW